MPLQKIEKSGYLMGTDYKIIAFGQSQNLSSIIEEVITDLERLENLLSFYIPTSDVGLFNRGLLSEVEFQPETKIILHTAAQIEELSHGAFDAFYRGDLDLGGIAKGYAADHAISFLKEAGLYSACFDLGGNVKTFGLKPDMSEWQIGIQHPTAKAGDLACIIQATDLSVVTSGFYERGLHIIDPASQSAVETDLSSVSIIGSNSMWCDALATAVIILGQEKGCALLSQLPDFSFILQTTAAEIICDDLASSLLISY